MNPRSWTLLARRLTAVAGLGFAASAPLFAAEIHVAPHGQDANPGTAGAPFHTLPAARDAARRFAGREPVTVHVADGVYYLDESLVFSAADSGTATAPVVYRADHEGRAVLSGGLKLDLVWRPFRDGILQARTPDGLVVDQLFVNGARQRMARYPNYDASRPTAAWQGYAADAFSKERAARWLDPTGAYIHAMHVARWGGYHYRITGKNPDGTVAYFGGWQNNRQMGMHRDLRMVENILEELDAAGEWFHDRKTATIYFQPELGFDPARASIEVVRLRHLVEARGTSQQPVTHLSLEGFVFRHTARTFMDTREPLLRSDWTIYRGGAVLLAGTEDVTIRDCEFDQPGGNGVFVSGYNRRARIQGCHLHDTGASGVCFVGLPSAVRNPLFEYGQTQDLAQIDRTPGPRSEDYPADCIVDDCLIHGIGRVERQVAGVEISMAARITVRDTSIYDCARAGINVSEGTWGGHLIDRCDIFSTVLETDDHGSFNSWGRDRYWCSNHRGISEPAVRQDPRLPFLDAVEPTVLRYSRWRCDHGWDVDLDDGSSNYDIHHNLFLAGGLKFREGYRRKAWNNVMVNNGFHPHVWFNHSASELHANILMRAHAPIGQPPLWGELVDHNLFTSETARLRHLASGGDTNSLSGDPLFLDPAAGDFRVKEGSPALRLGFQNFPMDQFGVKKASLRAIARTPAIPVLAPIANVSGPARHETPPASWLGATLRSLEGQEFSAFGVRQEDGGVHVLAVPPESPAARAGLQKDDLIVAINGQLTSRSKELLAILARAQGQAVTVRLVRHQQPLELVIDPARP